MNDKSDAELLRAYADGDGEAAFREIVTRHTDFVYSAALRQVESSAAACDIAQGVFTDLARKAGSLAHGNAGARNSLAGWLHRATRYAALKYLRDNRRRLGNEREAMNQLLTNAEPPADWEQIRPTLDEALESLDDEDREALLLRYFKNEDFRAVGLALGVSDDAAQKRVSRAVEKLRGFFSHRNVTIGAAGLTVLISANAVQSAPVGLAVAISTAALAGTAAGATSTVITATKTIAMTTIQKTMIVAALAAAVGTGIFEARRASQLREQNQTLQQQQAAQIQELQRERDDATNRLAGLLSENARLKSLPDETETELLRLRGEVGTLGAQLAESKTTHGPGAGASTPQSQPNDLLEQQKQMARAKEADARFYLTPLFQYADQNQGQFPTNWDQIRPFFTTNNSLSAPTGTNDFEIVQPGQLNINQLGTNLNSIILIREYTAWPTYDGQWGKVYGFADGHLETVILPDGNFAAWEQTHLAPLQNQ